MQNVYIPCVKTTLYYYQNYFKSQIFLIEKRLQIVKQKVWISFGPHRYMHYIFYEKKQGEKGAVMKNF